MYGIVGQEQLVYHERFLVVDIGSCWYGFNLDIAQEEAVLVHILYSHKKTRLSISSALGINYIISCFDLTVAWYS